MKILGLDPGIERLGWGIVEQSNNNYYYQSCGCIKTSKNFSQQQRLTLLAHELKKIIRKEKPDCAVVEKLFFANNKKTAMAVAEARGVILFILNEEHIRTQEFTPLEVKMAITGNGRAEKHQVAWMVKNILKIKESITSDDALDALALCLISRK